MLRQAELDDLSKQKAEGQRRWTTQGEGQPSSSSLRIGALTPADNAKDGHLDKESNQKISVQRSVVEQNSRVVHRLPPILSFDKGFEIPEDEISPTTTTPLRSQNVSINVRSDDSMLDIETSNTDKIVNRSITGRRTAQSDIYDVDTVNIGNGSTKTLGNQAFDTPNESLHMGHNMGQIIGKMSIGSGSRTLIGNTYHYYTPALFGALRVLFSDTDEDAAIKYRRGRASFQSAMGQPTMPTKYLPHVSVSRKEVKTALIKIAVVCQFLDAAFAEYFRLVLSHLRDTTATLRRIREEICSRQADSTPYIGSLGEYCERLNTASEVEKQTSMERFRAHATGEAIQPYLQDALEVPYWNMMADQFIKSKQDNNQFTYETVLSVINDKRRELKLWLQQIKRKWPKGLPQEIEDGILRRVSVLDALLAQTTDKYDTLEEQEVQALKRSSTSEPDPTVSTSGLTNPVQASLPAQRSSVDDRSDLEKVSLLSLFFVFIAIAMVPFGMGFAGNWSAEPSDAIGLTSDPDFKWLIATTLLAIFGNIYAVVPLRKITRGTRANIISQVFSYFSMVLGIFSVAVYPYLNKAWSSSLSFFCSFFAIGSVFISAQYTSDTALAGLQANLKKKQE